MRPWHTHTHTSTRQHHSHTNTLSSHIKSETHQDFSPLLFSTCSIIITYQLIAHWAICLRTHAQNVHRCMHEHTLPDAWNEYIDFPIDSWVCSTSLTICRNRIKNVVLGKLTSVISSRPERYVRKLKLPISNHQSDHVCIICFDNVASM